MLRWVKLALQMRGKFLELEGVTGKTQGVLLNPKFY
jgi:hypothetical protein